MPVVQNTARDAGGNPVRATVTIRLIAGDADSVTTPGYTGDGTVLSTTKVRADDDGFWTVDLPANDDYLPEGTYYQVVEQAPGSRAAYEHLIVVPADQGDGPFELVGLLVEDIPDPDPLYLLATQKGASGGLATLDADGQVPADQLGNASGGGGGGAVSSVFGRTGAVTAQSGDYTKAQVGLSNVDNTSDPAKPVSTAQAAADAAVAAAAAAALASHEADTTSVHGIADTANLVLTNDSRLSDNRTPTAHAASHGSAGSDPVTVAQSQVTGLTAALTGKQDADADLTTIAAIDTGTAGVLATDGTGWIRKTYAALKTALGLVKADVGLGSVDNTADADKPISIATQAALDAKQPLDADLTTLASLTPTTNNFIVATSSAWASRTPAQAKVQLSLVRGDVGLANVDNTSDAGKPVSTAQQAALDLKANLASPTFTGTPSLPTGTTGVTQTAGNSSTALATTAFVTTADGLKADVASPTFTGTPAAPTATQGTNTTQLATTAFVQTAAGLLVPKSTVTTKGDLLVATASGTVTRLSVGSDNQVLTADAAQASGVKWASVGGTGDVVGPASSTDNAVVRFDGTTGKLIQQGGGATITDAGTLVLPGQATPSYAAGGLAYNTTSRSLSFFNDDSNVTMDIGQELWLEARNSTGSSIANGVAVYINGAHASGYPTIALAQANAEATSIAVGLATETIANGANGFVCTDGIVHGLDTSGFAAGDILYLSPTTPGGLVNTRPSSPNLEYRLGVVTRSHATLGSIYVDPGVRRTGLGTANQVFGMNSGGTGGEYKTLSGTSNRLTVTHGSGTVTLDVSSTLVSSLQDKATLTAKGDLYVATASGTVTRLPVGSNTQVLTADSTQTAGVKWAAASGSGTDYKTASRPRTGNWYRAPGFGPVGTNLTMSTLNRCYFVPFRLAATTTFDRIGVDVATAGSAGAVLRLGIYASDGTGDTPGTLILDAGTVAGDSTGAKQITISQSISAGVVWLCVCNQTASGTVIRAVVSYDPLIYYFSGASMFTGTQAPGSLVATGITGAFASNPTIADNDNGPIIGLRAA